MNESDFWNMASDTYNLYHDRYRRAILTDEEIREDISGFLTDVDLLATEWYNREDNNKGDNKEEGE